MYLKTRLAPTPSGYLHLGNAFSFLLTWLIARRQGGTVHLRIDDMDSPRTRPEYVQDIYESLQWLGLDWDTEAGSQQGRQGHYLAYFEQYKAHLAPYPCDCPRKKVQQNAKNGLYGQTCLPKTASEIDLAQAAWRLHIPESAEIVLKDVFKGTCLLKPAQWAGDMVVWQKNNAPSYQFASIIDDMEAGINFIVRGEDLWSSTIFQLYIAQKMGLGGFLESTFLHHTLLKDEVGNKLSKSEGATSLRALRKEGILPTYVYQKFAEFWKIEVSTLPTLAELREHLTFSI